MMAERNKYQQKWRKRKLELNQLAESDSHGESELDWGSCTNNSETSTQEAEHSDHSDSDAGLNCDESYDDFGYVAQPVPESSDEEICDEPEAAPDLDSQLRDWINDDKIPHRSANKLFQILREQGHRLPKDARTLLGTLRSVEVLDRCGGQYKYFGLESGISTCIATSPLFFETHNEVALNFNIDGIPLFKSNSIEFWPILCQFADFDPFIVGIFCGTKKPSPLEDFLQDFMEELKIILDNGIIVNEKHFDVSVRCFVCDAPARAMLKCIKGHGGYYSCERCTVKGQYEREEKKGEKKKQSGRVVLVASENEVIEDRTDEAFSNHEYSDHQFDLSPLSILDLCLVTLFVLDYMHLVCLGVVKRTLTFLRQGPYVCKLSASSKTLLGEKLTALAGYMPSEFARQPRSLNELDRWKATEFRQFLLYTGPLVLKDVVKSDTYHHFLTLSVGMSILLDTDDEKRRGNLDYAKQLLTYFVNESTKLYGKTFPVYNVHSLIHLVDDARRFDCSLNMLSAFPFENFLQQVKKMVRNGKNPIAQVAKRLSEKGMHQRGPRGKSMIISTTQKDSCFILNNSDYAFVIEKKENDTLLVDILRKEHLNPLYQQPCSSLLINVGHVKLQRVRLARKIITREELYRKVVCLPYKEDGVALFPLLHEKEKE